MRTPTILILLGFVTACGTEDVLPSGPGYPGAGADYQPMPRASAMRCFYGEDDPATPAATIEHVLEVYEGVDSVHVRLTLDPRFVDNTYGDGSIGWGDKGHSYKKLDGSDHAQLLLYADDDELAMDFALDYITDGVSEGVNGGDGEVSVGEPDWVVGWTTSLELNFNARGYADFREHSPLTDEGYTPNPSAPMWDYRVVYEAWVDLAAFGDAGFGSAEVEYIHASPAKQEDNTIIVDPDDCPPDWDPEGECNDPDGCDNEPTDPDDECNDPDGCDNEPTDPGPQIE